MTLLLLISSMLSTAHAARPSVVWTGIDYGQVTMVGSNDFRDAEAIFPGYLQKWNGLAVEEQTDDLKRRAKINIDSIDLSALSGAHAGTSGERNINRDDGLPFRVPYLSASDIAGRVAGYELRTTSGTGLVFVADHLHKLAEVGCYHVVFYDIATREVRQAEFQCGAARGIGFRNYWFGTFKGSVDTMSRFRG